MQQLDLLRTMGRGDLILRRIFSVFQWRRCWVIFLCLSAGGRLLAAEPAAPGAATAATLSRQGDFFILQPKPATRPVVNPGKGWVIYGSPSQQPPELLALGSMAYTRYNWGSVEPTEGNYHWEIIDRDLDAWAKAGKQFAFGVMGANSHSKDFWVTPKYVFDAGAHYSQFELNNPKMETSGTPGIKLVPVFDDPVYMAKLEKFVRAMAARYDGNPNIAFIDIRSYGNWGESHMSPFGKPDISAEKYKNHLALYRSAFQKTPLQVCCGRSIYRDIYTWAVDHGIGLRRDGICGNSDGSDVLPCAGRLPAVFEFYGSYEMMVKLGWWYGRKDKNGNGYRLKDCVETGQPTWCSLGSGSSALKMLAAERPLIDFLSNRLGYHLVLQQFRFPAAFKSKATATLDSTWVNRGVAPMFIAAGLWYALLDERGNPVEECAASSTKPGEWKSDKPVEVHDRVSFSRAKPGYYTLALGLKRPGLPKPTIRLGIEGETVNGWQILGKVKVTE